MDSYFPVGVMWVVFVGDFVSSRLVMGIIANITRQQTRRNVGNIALMEPMINFTFRLDVVQSDAPRILQVNSALLINIESDRRASPATHWDIKSNFRTRDDKAAM